MLPWGPAPDMSLLATLILAWAAVHTYVGVFHGILHLRRRSDREYLAFAVLAFGLAVYCFGQALLTDARSLDDGTRASRIAMVGLAVVPAAVVDLCLLLVGRGRARLITVAYGWSILGLAANLAGLFHDPMVPTDAAPDVLYHEPQLTALGAVWAVVASGLTILTVLRAGTFLAREPALRLLIGAVAISVSAATVDLVVHLLGLPLRYTLEHASLATSFLVSYVLLRRFVEAGDELTRRTYELRRSYEELRSMQQELVRKEQLAAVGELSAVVAHEVRNPLAVMKNSVSGLRRTAIASPDRGLLLDIVDEEADRLGRLVNDLLSYARPVAPRGDPVELSELVRDCLGAATRHRIPDDIEVELELEGPAMVHCDRDLLARALTNVVDNALQAMPGGGTLTIRSLAAELDGRPAVSLEVRDTGEGMDTLVRSKARDPFFTTRPAGTGLGLAIVERVIRAHGGELRIESRYGSGTAVQVLVPVQGAGTDAAEAESDEVASPPAQK